MNLTKKTSSPTPKFFLLFYSMSFARDYLTWMLKWVIPLTWTTEFLNLSSNFPLILIEEELVFTGWKAKMWVVAHQCVPFIHCHLYQLKLLSFIDMGEKFLVMICNDLFIFLLHSLNCFFLKWERGRAQTWLGYYLFHRSFFFFPRLDKFYVYSSLEKNKIL